MTSKQDKEQLKGLKYYWENRYFYMSGFFKKYFDMKKNNYLLSKRVILLLLALIVGNIYKEGLPSNNNVLALSFLTATFVSIVYFLFLNKEIFLKRMILFICLFVCLFVCLFALFVTPFIDRGLPKTEFLLFLEKISCYFSAFFSLYIMFYVSFLSIYAVIFSFIPEKRFNLMKIQKKKRNYILTFIMLISGYLPSLGCILALFKNI